MISISTDPVHLPNQHLEAGSLIMDGGKKNIDILRSNLDRDTQCPMYRMSKIDRCAIFYNQ
jgi:hypothetical protein